MYRIPLTKSGAIPQVTADDRRLPVVDIPLEIEHAPGEIILPDNVVKTVDTYVFYCHSKPSSEKQQTGDGTKENPWDDLNVALEKLCCIIHNSCDNCIACKLIVSGTVDYKIRPSYGYYNGKHRLCVDCDEAVFLYSEYDEYGRISRLKNMSLVNVDFTDTFKPDSPESYSATPAMYDCFGCRFEKITISTAARAFYNCEDCVFRDVSVQINSVNFEIRAVYRCHNSLFDDCNVFVQGNKENHGHYWGFTENDDSVFSNCTATFFGTGCCTGCGFFANDNPTWLGSNIGYVLNPVYDVNGECHSFSLTQTNNENCTIVPESSVPPPSSSSGGVSNKGSILCHAFTRSTSYRLWATTYDSDSSPGKQKCYVVDVNFNWEHAPCRYIDRASINAYHGFIGTLDCEKVTDVDENGNEFSSWECWGECYCDEGKFIANDGVNVFEKPASLANSAAVDANVDVTKWINGTLYELPEPDDIPVDKTGWYGFKNYCRSGSLTHISPHQLNKKGDTLTVNTKTEADFYNSWEEYPCGNGDDWGIITLDTYVFEWRPEDENDKVKPKYFILEDADGNEIKCNFMTEYCLQGNEDIDRDMLSLTTCNSVSGMNNHDETICNFVIVKGTTKRIKKKLFRTARCCDQYS